MSRSEYSLIFMTYQYPYLPGEYFIESEIAHLAKTFSRVYVFPYRCLWWKSSQPPRSMPEGVELWDPAKIPASVIASCYLRAVLQAPFLVRLQLRSWPGHPDLPKIKYLKALRMAFKTLVTRFALEWFGNKDKAVFKRMGYAYWRDTGASALALSCQAMDLGKLVVRAHRTDIYQHQIWPDESTIHNLADMIYPVSEDGAKYLVEHKGLPGSKVEVARLGVNIPQDCSKPSVDGVLRIVSCSNVIPVKRVDLIAQVVANLPGKVEWTHIGDGPDLANVKLQTRGFYDGKAFVAKGRLSNQKVYEYYQSHPADIFINLSESEGVPVSIMEAMALGIPCVATNVGGTAEIVNDENGAVVSVDADVAEICSAVERVMNNLEARAKARKQAEVRCSAERNYHQFCEMLTE